MASRLANKGEIKVISLFVLQLPPDLWLSILRVVGRSRGLLRLTNIRIAIVAQAILADRSGIN